MVAPKRGSGAQAASPTMAEFAATLFRNGSIEYHYLDVHGLENISACSGISNAADPAPIDMTSAVMQGTSSIRVMQHALSTDRDEAVSTTNVDDASLLVPATNCGGVVRDTFTHRVCTQGSDANTVSSCSGEIVQPDVDLLAAQNCATLLQGTPDSTFGLFGNHSFLGGLALVIVYDGPDARSPELLRLTGEGQVSPGVRSSGSALYIVFSVQSDQVNALSQAFVLGFSCEQPSAWSPADAAIPISIGSTWTQPSGSILEVQKRCFRGKAKRLHVQCCADAEMDCSTARVVGLKLRGLNIRGTIDPAVGRLRALRDFDMADNFISGTLPVEIGQLHRLEHLRLEHNQLGIQSPATIASILDGFADLRSLELSTSSETVDLTKTLIVPVPPIQCAVGSPCQFTVVTRTEQGDHVTRGGKNIVVEPTVWLGEDDISEEQISCADAKDGSYQCDLPQRWISREGILEFQLAADSEPIIPMRTIENIETGLTRVSEAYPDLSIQIGPIACTDTHAHPTFDGSTCACEPHLIEIVDPQDASLLRCDSCSRGKEPTPDLRRCTNCEFGQYSADGIECLACEPGAAPNLKVAAYQCELCDSSSISTDGTECIACPPGQVADSTRRSCVCPVGDYNSTLFGGQNIQCVDGDLQAHEMSNDGVCQSCRGLQCVQCDVSGATIQEGWSSLAVGSSAIFKCTTPEACELGGGCAQGYTGTLCESCADGFGEASGLCESCGTDRGSWVGWALGLCAVAVGALYLAHTRRRCQQQRGESKDDESTLADSLTENPLATSGTPHAGTPRASTEKRIESATTLFRAVYQPVRILVIFGQVVTQVGPVLHMTFPAGIQSVITLLHPLAIDVQAFLQLGCLGYSFYSMWMIRVFVVPLLLVGCAASLHMVKRSRGELTSNAMDDLKSSLFIVCFLVYPGVCNRSFSLFNCRRLTDSMSVLTSDYSIVCESDEHRAFQIVGFFVIVCFAIGVPIGTMVLMFRRMQEYRGQHATDKFIARRVADELKVSDEVALDTMRDIAMGRQYSFLLSSFKPRY